MASNTTHLQLLKKDVKTDGHETFNIKTMLNDNWDKIDNAFGQTVYENEMFGLRINENLNIEFKNTETGEWVEVKSGSDGAPLKAHNYKIPATTEGQTEFEIPLVDYDPNIDVMLVTQNRTVLESDEYTITQKGAKHFVTLVDPVKDHANTSISLLIFKGNVMVGDIADIPVASTTKAGIVALTSELGDREDLAVTQKALNEVSNEVTEVTNKVGKFESEKNLSIIKSNKDAEGIFTTVTYKRKADNTTYCVSTLSGGSTPLYTTKTEQYFDAAGTNVINTITYTLAYDDDGNLISEV